MPAVKIPFREQVFFICHVPSPTDRPWSGSTARGETAVDTMSVASGFDPSRNAAVLIGLMPPDGKGRAPRQRELYARPLERMQLDLMEHATHAVASADAAGGDPTDAALWQKLHSGGVNMSAKWAARTKTQLCRHARGEAAWRVWLDGWSGKAGASCEGYFEPYGDEENAALEVRRRERTGPNRIPNLAQPTHQRVAQP